MKRENLRTAFLVTAGISGCLIGYFGNLSHTKPGTGAQAAATFAFEEESREAERESEKATERETTKAKVETTQTYAVKVTAPETQTVTTIATTAVEPTEAPTEPIVVTTEETPVETTNEPSSATSQATGLFTDYERALLLKVGSVEAGGQGTKGIALVMRVVLNRAILNGCSIEAVIYAPRQFASTRTALWAQDYTVADAYEALAWIESGWDESQGALYFCTTPANAWHSKALTFLYKWGDHEFYK